MDRISLKAKIERLLVNSYSEETRRSLNVPRLISNLLDLVPDKAFDPLEPIDDGIILLNDNITKHTVHDVQMDLIEANLNLPKRHRLRIDIHSYGGGVTEGFGLISTIQDLQRQGRKVDIAIRGHVASMGTVIVQAGNKRTIDRYGSMMLHEISWWMPRLKIGDHEDELAACKVMYDQLLQFYANRSTKPLSYFKSRTRRKDWYLTAEECLELGLVDEIVSEPAY